MDTSRRRLRDFALVRLQTIFGSPESPRLPRLISRGSLGDVSAGEIRTLVSPHTFEKLLTPSSESTGFRFQYVMRLMRQYTMSNLYRLLLR